VVVLRGSESVDEVRARQADALVSRQPGIAIAVRTADCVPVLIGDTVSGAVAAVHAGWRGVVAGVIVEAVAALEAKDPAALIAAIGPSIGPCCFEVDQDVALSIAQAGGDGIVIKRGGEKPHVDLWRAIEHQLRSAGISSVNTVSACTTCDHARFFSYRRDGSRSGRMLSVILARG
jgi:YfiH family protein